MRLPFIVLFVSVGLSTACKKEEPALPMEDVSPLHVTGGAGEDDAEELTEARDAVHSADALLQQEAPGVKVDEALVKRFVEYRRRVVQRSTGAVEAFSRESRAAAGSANQTVAMRAARASQLFAEKMRDIEETAREETKLSRDEVSAAARVVGAVLAQREIWRLSGGDEAVKQAEATFATLTEAEQAHGKAALQASLDGFAQMREAKEARRIHGDAAVDAVLAQEEVLRELQRESTQVMSQVY